MTRGESDILKDSVELSEGLVYFEAGGPAGAPTVVLVHGFSVPSYSWDHTFGFLVQAGFRVVRYDLYGRGFSAKPRIPYNKDLYDEQLSELLVALHVTSPVHLVGLSMGGAIVTVFASRRPQLVRRLCLISPAGTPGQHPLSLYLMMLPGLGDLIMRLAGNVILNTGVRMDLYAPEKFPKYFEMYRSQMQSRGFHYSLLSTLRSGMLYDLEDEYKMVGSMGIRTTLIWGKEDRVIPFAEHEKIMRLIPDAEFHAIDAAGHASHYECPEVVNPILLDSLLVS